MKLRVRGNSVRLRLGRAEVERAGEGFPIEEITRFSSLQRLVTRFEPADVTQPEAVFVDGTVRVRWPRVAVRAWSANEEVSLEAHVPLEGEEGLRLLVEKDFACLAPRPDEDESDAYPHPNAGTDRTC